MAPSSKPPASKGPRRRRVKKQKSLPPREPRGSRVSSGESEAASQRQKKILANVGLAALAVVAFMIALGFSLLPSMKGPGTGKTVVIDVARGASWDDVAESLEHDGIIVHRTYVSVLKTLLRLGSPVEGHHLVRDNLSLRELLRRLSKRGSGERAKVVVPEGFNRYEIAKRLEKEGVCGEADFLQASSDTDLLRELRIERTSAEGYLFPLSYEFPSDSIAIDVVRRMVLEFERRYALLTEKHGAKLLELEAAPLSFGRDEIVTLASMVEKEAVVDDERPIIAGVFVNRLRDAQFTPKLLQSDPTGAYACFAKLANVEACSTFRGKITPALLHDPDNVYSTYITVGLPPSPIANPGQRSLEGVLNFATHHYYFFVAKGGGRHTFTEKYSEHQKAIEEGRAR